MIKAVTWPDIPVIREQKHSDVDIATVYLSDIHIGSRYFVEKAFKKFIRWLWGEEGNVELAGKVKYVVIAGDVCDGIGVYPNQEKELVVKDIYAQYAMFDQLVQSFPDHIVTVVGPGNHDAVRRAEPQPYIPMDMIKSDVKKIGSPATLEIEGLKHLVYHGTSIDSIIANISGLSYSKPDGPMVEMLKRRHLSPIYGENLIVPEHRDYMLIEEEPDVVHMGHIHKNAARKYRGTLLINSGTFQERTEFQVKMGHVPTPGIVPVLEMQSGNLSHLNFLGD
jgi:DNA polymerase II small subunit